MRKVSTRFNGRVQGFASHCGKRVVQASGTCSSTQDCGHTTISHSCQRKLVHSRTCLNCFVTSVQQRFRGGHSCAQQRVMGGVTRGVFFTFRYFSPHLCVYCLSTDEAGFLGRAGRYSVLEWGFACSARSAGWLGGKVARVDGAGIGGGGRAGFSLFLGGGGCVLVSTLVTFTMVRLICFYFDLVPCNSVAVLEVSLCRRCNPLFTRLCSELADKRSLVCS